MARRLKVSSGIGAVRAQIVGLYGDGSGTWQGFLATPKKK